ncbi:MAG TPA: Dabb family protein [Segetibacter sp.]|jgi:hypothetical protein
MFTHHVFFWLKEELSQQDTQNFETGVKSLLSIAHLSSGDVGKPASTARPVIDSSYSYSLLLQFTDEAAHDAYQVDPIHEKFVERCSPYWSKVLIYDSETV